MTAQENETLARRFVEEVWNDHDLDAVDELFSPDYTGHWFELTGEDVGRDGLKAFVQNVLTGFPDYEMDIEYVHADDEIVEGWASWDALGLLQRLGILPQDPSQAASADD